MTKCPVCRASLPVGDYGSLSEHFLWNSSQSEPGHVRWLNQSIGSQRLDHGALAARLQEVFALPPEGLAEWVRARFIARFYGKRVHPFVQALQHPSRATLLGYVVEHQHFLREWIRCCGFVLAKTDREDVARYEIDNILVEFGRNTPESPSHYELLLRMGESYGLSREDLLATPALPTTRRALDEWHRICEAGHWLEGMAAMHSLELIADRTLVGHGASLRYFDPAILDGDSVTAPTKAFLREGYEADAEHTGEALDLVVKYATDPRLIEEVQGTVLRSIDLFDDYLGARLQRSEEYGPSG